MLGLAAAESATAVSGRLYVGSKYFGGCWTAAGDLQTAYSELHGCYRNKEDSMSQQGRCDCRRGWTRAHLAWAAGFFCLTGGLSSSLSVPKTSSRRF